VDGAKVTVKCGEDKEVVLTTNDKTKVTVDGRKPRWPI